MFRSYRKGAPGARLIILAASLLAAGCVTSGPVTVRRDRFNFNDAGAESTKEQILLNIVRLRYGEPIYFVDIGSMLSHYTFSASGHYSNYKSDLDVWSNPALRAVYGMRGEPVPGSSTWGANLDYMDSPTITYNPVTGEEFATRVMAPIPPTTIIYLSQSGWSIDRVLECCVQQINDVGNAPIHELAGAEPPDIRRFRRLAEILKRAQDEGYLRFGIESVAGENATYLYLPSAPAGLESEAREVKELLGVSSEPSQRIRLTGYALRLGPNEIAMQTRSLYGCMYALAQGVSVPTEHVQGRQTATRPARTAEEDASRWLRVQHSRLPQIDPFAQVFYNGYWFYIDRSDWPSKRTFALLTYMLSLQSTVKGRAEPLLTVPTGG